MYEVGRRIMPHPTLQQVCSFPANNADRSSAILVHVLCNALIDNPPRPMISIRIVAYVVLLAACSSGVKHPTIVISEARTYAERTSRGEARLDRNGVSGTNIKACKPKM
jgi:hypothetical protein